MSLYKPNEFMMKPTKCHICDQEVREDQHGIEHTGHGQMTNEKQWSEGFVAVWFHPECAIVMAMRLSHDVMRVKMDETQPRRVVDALQDLAKVNQVR